MRLEEVFAKILNEPAVKMSDATSPENTRSWDSLRFIELITEIENQYGVSFDTLEIATLESLGGVRQLLKRKGVTA